MLRWMRTSYSKLSLRWQLAASFFAIPLFTGIFLYLEIGHVGAQILEESGLSRMRRARKEVFYRIDAYLDIPETVVKLNAVLAGRGALPLNDGERLSRILFFQRLQEPSVDFLFYANEAGGIASVGSNRGRHLVSVMRGMKKGEFVVNEVDENGKFVARRDVVRDFDPREREWYKTAKESRSLFWSSPYAGTFEPTLAISTSYPHLASSGEAIGVFGADVLLGKLESFLESLHVSPNGYAFLVEPDGTIVANSVQAPVFERRGDAFVRVNALDSKFTPIRDAATVISEMNRSEKKEPYSRLVKGESGERYYIDISAYSRKDLISWYLILVVPQSDLAQAIRGLLEKLFWVVLIGLAAALVLSWRVGSWITGPVRSLRSQAEEVASGHYGAQVDIRRADEIGQLAKAFNYMSQRLHQAYQELVVAKEAAESASRVKSEFLDVAAHELRTPMTSASLLVQLMRRMQTEGKQLPPSYLERISKQMQRLSGLVDDLLNLSRLERGGLALHLARGDLVSVIRESLDDFGRRFPSRKFTYQGPAEPVYLEMDATRIYQVISNFLDNAVKYAPEGPSIDTEISVGEEAVRVSVRDHGPGIPKQLQAEIFTKFYRATTDLNLGQPGLGLGLYICRRIIDLHSGKIGVESEPGKGSTFYFDLPKQENA